MEGEEESCDGEISIGPFGSSSGKAFSYRGAKDAIKQIVIIHNKNAVHSIMFKGGGAADNEYSKPFGQGFKTGVLTNIDIDFPTDYLTGISGTYFSDGLFSVESLKFYTKLTEYGPYGSQSGTPFSFRQRGGLITGFHGQADEFIYSIGVYLKPLSSVFGSIPTKETSVPNKYLLGSCGQVPIGDSIKIQKQIRVIEDVVPRDPGPWGGSCGKKWDDGVFSAIKQIQITELTVCPTANAIVLVQFVYVGRDGSSALIAKHGCGMPQRKIDLDYENEFLIGISGFYGPMANGKVGPDVIKSITFYSNLAKYGPYGEENGTYFTSISSRAKVVGFRGSSGKYLHSIGVHLEYI